MSELHYISSRAPLSQPIAPHPHIPHHIFQTWDTAEVSPGMHAAMSSWRDLNPDWAYHFYSDADCEQFIAEHFEQAVLDAYQQLIPGAYRADLWRYCVLYIHGGFYADAKFQLLAPLNSVLPRDAYSLLFRDRYRKNSQAHDAYIYQGMIAFCPAHPVLKTTIDQIVLHVKQGYYGDDPLDITGPSLLGKIINRSLGRVEVAALSPQDYFHSAGTYRILPPHGDNNKTTPDLHNSTLIYTQYYKERTKDPSSSRYRLDKDYAACWFRREVFRHGRIASDAPSAFYLRRYRHFWVRHTRTFYQWKQIKEARESFKLAYAKGAISIRLVSKVIIYEARHAAKIFFKKIGQIINNSIT